MLSLELRDFLIQLKDGTINNAGGPTKSAVIKLYDVADVEARPFGDERVKLAFEDSDGNSIEIAISPTEIATLESDIKTIRSSGMVEGF